MRFRHRLCLAPVLALLATEPARAEVRFETEPHVLALDRRQQVVLFSEEGTGGAMATRRPDGSFDVIVPDAGLAHALYDRDFVGPPVGDDGAGTVVSLERTEAGDVRIHIRPAGDVARVVPHAVRGPDRLLIDLLPAKAESAVEAKVSPKPEAAKPKSVPEVTAAPREPAPPASIEKLAAASAVAEDRGEPERASTTPSGPAVATRSLGEDVVEERGEPEAIDAEHATTDVAADDTSKGRSQTLTAHALPGMNDWTCDVGGGPAPAPPVCLASNEERTVARSTKGPQAEGETPGVTTRIATPALAPSGDVEAPHASPVAMLSAGANEITPGCRFRRANGFAFCAPTPGRRGYSEDPYAAGVAHRIAAGATWLAPVQLDEATPAGVYLKADRQFLVDSREGYFLTSVRAYQRAVRNRPEFPDAERAWMNIALIYAGIGFDVELEIEALNPSNPARDFAQAVLGDLRRDQGRLAEAAALYELARHGRPLSACWAARGLAAVALEEGRVKRARDGLGALEELCPTEVLLDFETERLRAAVEVAGGEPDKALATLAMASKRASVRQRAEVARERALVAETGGRTIEAREIWVELERGDYGEEFALEAGIALARLGGTPDEIRQGLERANALPQGTRERARKELFDGVSHAARSSGDDLAPLSLVLSDGLEPELLNVRSRIGMAAAYRKVGLMENAAAVLDGIAHARTGGLPEAYWEERAAVALGLGDLAATEAALVRWRTSRGGNPSAGELSTRARLLARRGDSPVVIERILSRLEGIDRELAAETRWQVASIQADGDPVAALSSLGGQQALSRIPDLPEEQIGETLWAVGRSAEGSGETELALAAYRSLATHLPATARGADAAYRAGRLLEERDAYAEARREYRRAETHPDELDRRFAEATSAFHELVEPWTRRLEEE